MINLRKIFPDNRELLTKACELRLRIAQAECERVTDEETERLEAAGINEYAIKESPLIKKVVGNVNHLAAVLDYIKTCPAEEIWKNTREFLE